MAYKTLYKGSFLNAESDINNDDNQQQVDIYIYDTESGEGAVETTIDLELAGDPLKMRFVNNSENKFEVINSKSAEIRVLTSDTVSLDTFVDGGDRRWFVEIYYGGNLIFQGWLITSDIEQDFLPDPNELVLTANDGLGFLDSEELTDFDGNPPTGVNSIFDYTAWCLNKSGIHRDIFIAANLREKTRPSINLTSLVTGATFNAVLQSFNVSETKFFYPGQSVTISGTANNNGSVTIKSVSTSGGLTTVTCTGTRLAETVSATFTDNDPSMASFANSTFLEARTFENNDGFLNCREVLQSIWKYHARIVAVADEVYIIRVDEIENGAFTMTSQQYDGTFLDIISYNPFTEIGSDKLLSWMNDDTRLSAVRPVKFVKLTGDFDYPKSIPDNIEFDKGDFIADLPDETIDGDVFNVKKYALDNWTLGRYSSNDPENPSPASNATYIKRYFQNGYEKKRFVVVTNDYGTSNPYSYIRSNPIYLSKGDKADASVDFKYSSPPAGNDHVVAGFVFLGESGATYYLNSYLPAWVSAVANLFFGTVTFTYTDDDQKNDFQGISYNIAPVPEDGTLYIFLSSSFDSDGKDLYYSNLNLTIYPLINGSYEVYKGQYTKVTQSDPDKYKEVIDDSVKISDFPRRLMKGALLKIVRIGDSPVYGLTEGFYDARRYPDGYTDDEQIKPFAIHQAQDIWWQNNRTMRTFEGTADRLGDIPDLINRFILTDVGSSTNNKIFAALHLGVDLFLCETDIFLAEVFDETVARPVPETDFKYYT